MSERHGERPDTPETEPAPTITSKARTARWYDRRQGTGTGGARKMVRPIPDNEPAPTLGAAGLATGRDVWIVEDGRSDDFQREPRASDEPAATVGTTARQWHKRPAPTLVTTRRSKDGMLVGRQLPDGEGENVGGKNWKDGDPRERPEWTNDRPSTSVVGDARIGRPGHKDYAGGESHFSKDAVRVTVEEASILQGFPPDYPWQGSRSKQFEQIGNAVPPPLAWAVIAALVKENA